MNRIEQLARQAEHCLDALAYSEAAAFLEEALGQLAMSQHPDLVLRARLLRQLKEVYAAQDEPVSEELLAELLTELVYLDNLNGELGPATVQLYDELADCYLRSNDTDSAIQTLHAALNLMDDLQVDTLHDRIYVLLKLATLHEREDQLPAATQCLQQVVEIQQQQGDNGTATLLLRLARYAQLSNDTTRAEHYYREAIAAESAAEGRPSLSVAEVKASLAEFYASVKRHVAAEKQYERALEMLEQCPPTDRLHELMPRLRIGLSNLYLERDELRQALEQLDLAAQYFEALSEQHTGERAKQYLRNMADIRLTHADHLFDANEHDMALTLYSELYNTFYDLVGPSVALARCLQRMGRTMELMRETAEAERYYRDAEAMIIRFTGPTHPDLALIRKSLAQMEQRA